ncbi:MAG: Uma2 family endonuclease [Halanaerobiales bacterium]
MRVNSTDLQNSFGKYLSLVEKEDIIVVRNGKTVAKLVHYTEPENFLVHEKSEGYRATRKISYEEYMSLVDSSNQRYELIDGEVYLLASPSYRHQVLVNEISWHFNNYFRDKSCRSLTAPLDVKLSGYALKFKEDPNVVQPDIFVICDEDNVNEEEDKYEGVPALVIEVLSPSTRSRDLAIKLHLYMKSGVSEYWVVDPEEKEIMQYTFDEERELQEKNMFVGDETIKSVKFPELRIKLEDIFSEI